MIVIKAEYCEKKYECLAKKFCPGEAILQVLGEFPTIDYTRCIDCGKCVYFCPAFIRISED